MHTPLRGMRRDEAGATAIEYAMVALLVSIAGFSALVTIGSSVSQIFSNVANAF